MHSDTTWLTGQGRLPPAPIFILRITLCCTHLPLGRSEHLKISWVENLGE